MADYADDLTIADEAPLWRRIPPDWWVFDGNLGRVRPSSQAFSDHANGSPMSVVLGNEVLAEGRSSADVLAGHGGFCLASITAALAREKEQGIRRDPLPDEPAHAEVFGRKRMSVKNAFAKQATWVVPPPDTP